MNKKLVVVVGKILIILILGVIMLNYHHRLNQLEHQDEGIELIPQMASQTAVPLEVLQGYEEACYKSYTEDRKEFVHAKIDHYCLDEKMNNCEDNYDKCDLSCWKSFVESEAGIVETYDFKDCKAICSGNYQECAHWDKKVLEENSKYVLAESHGCLESPYIKNFTVEICDEWMWIKKRKEKPTCDEKYDLCMQVCSWRVEEDPNYLPCEECSKNYSECQK